MTAARPPAKLIPVPFPSKSSRRFLLLAFAGCLFVSSVNCGIREDELRCEEAAAHLADCCPGFKPSILDCSYVPGDGCVQHHDPDIHVEEARCMDGLDCAAIDKNDLCNRVRQAVESAQSQGTAVMVTCP